MSVCQESSEHAPLSHVFSSSKQMTQFKSPFSLIPPSFLNNPIEHEIQNYQIPLFTNSKTPAFPSPRFPGTKNEKKQKSKSKSWHTHFRGGGLQSMPRGRGEEPSCRYLGGLGFDTGELPSTEIESGEDL